MVAKIMQSNVITAANKRPIRLRKAKNICIILSDIHLPTREEKGKRKRKTAGKLRNGRMRKREGKEEE